MNSTALARTSAPCAAIDGEPRQRRQHARIARARAVHRVGQRHRRLPPLAVAPPLDPSARAAHSGERSS